MLRSRVAETAHMRHVRWIIANAPESEVAGHVVMLPVALDPRGYETVRDLWLAQAERPCVSLQIIRNATTFLMGDSEEGERLLRRARDVEPTSREWSERLARLYLFRADIALTLPMRRQAATLAMQFVVEAMGVAEGHARYRLLKLAAKAAFELEDLGSAWLWSTEMVTGSSVAETPWDMQDGIHLGHRMLGRIELLDGNVERGMPAPARRRQTTGTWREDRSHWSGNGSL